VLSKGTLLTMLLSIGVYWTAWGWRFALGLVVGIYVHEIGHVAALQARGVKAEAPMFVPGLGAFVRHVPLNDPAAEARVALAGPLWGLGVALAAVLAFAGTGAGIWAGIAQWTARLNLFNLVPLPPLDGDKAFRGLSSGQRWLFVAATAAVMFPTREGVLWLVLGLGVLRALSRSEDRPPDWPLFGQAVFTLLALASLCAIPVPVPPQE
jgi:Zn-dependent protease